MTLVRSLTFALLALFKAIPNSDAFIFDAFTAYPALQELAKAQKDCQLSIRLDVGTDSKSSPPWGHKPARMFLDGLSIDLLQERAPAGHVPLPGATGPHPKTSSGARALRVNSLPFFVGMNGKETVAMEKCAWEIVWREQAPAGALICGFDVPIAAVRNDAKLPVGRLYMSFPVWTPELLAEQQVVKAEAERRANEYIQEKNAALQAMQETDNVISKLFHYRDAAAAYEKLELTGFRSYQWIPDRDDVVPMQNGILLGRQGSIWSISNDLFKKQKHSLGDAIIRPSPDDKNMLRP